MNENELVLGFAFMFVMIVIIIIPIYIYLSKIIYEIAKEEGRKGAFLAWIPGGNFYLICKLGHVSFIVWIILQFVCVKYDIQIGGISPVSIYTVFAYNRIFKRYSVNKITMYMSYIMPFFVFISLWDCYSKLKKIRKNRINNYYNGNYNNNYNNYNDYDNSNY